MSKLQDAVSKFKSGKVAPHIYRSDGASRDPECSVKGCKWDWDKHLDTELLAIVKESAQSAKGEREK